MSRDERPTDERADCYATALRKAARRITQLYEHTLAKTGLTSTQFSILVEANARAEEPPSVAELAKALVIERSALGHTLRPLERDGLITLEPAREDARRKNVVLTKRGRAKLRDALPLWRDAQARFAERVGAESAARLRDALLDIAHDPRLGEPVD